MNDIDLTQPMSRERYKSLRGLGFKKRKKFKRNPNTYRQGICLNCHKPSRSCKCMGDIMSEAAHQRFTDSQKEDKKE